MLKNLIMTFAVIQTGGKQYKVKVKTKIERLKDNKNKIEFKDILAYGDDKNVEVKIFGRGKGGTIN